MMFTSIAAINHEIIDHVKNLEIYSGEKQEMRWKHKTANLVFCYFGLSETDVVNGNYICHTTWARESQDQTNWYKTGKNYETIADVNFYINPNYEFIKQFVSEHTASKNELIAETNRIIHRMISLAEKIILIYNEYMNDVISETALIREVSRVEPEIRTLYYRETELDIPPDDIVEWCNQCSLIAACIHDMTLYYSKETFLNRTPENRKSCMDISINQYYKDLENLREIEKTCEH